MAEVDMKKRFEEWHTRKHEAGQVLLDRIKAKLPELEAILKRTEGEWGFEDNFYRYYHHSFKVFQTQSRTEEIVTALFQLAPDGRNLSPMFMRIVEDARFQKFGPTTNENWEAETRPVLEAFFHARHFLEQAIKYGKELDTAPAMLPTGWATVLYLYGLR